MDADLVIALALIAQCVTSLFMLLTRIRRNVKGWVFVYSVVILFEAAGIATQSSVPVHTGLILWLLFILTPGLLSTAYSRSFLRQDYSRARRIARAISLLHPADGMADLPEIIGAHDLAQKGDFKSATEILGRFRATQSLMGMFAVSSLFRLTQSWEEFSAWQAEHLQEMEKHPSLLATILRVRAETGDLCGMVKAYEQYRTRIAKLIPVASRDQCRLCLFAFCGERELVERLFAGSLSAYPAPIREYWIATAEIASGSVKEGRRRLENMLPSAEPSLRLAIERRLSRDLVCAEPLDDASRRVIREAALEQSHDTVYGATPSLFSLKAKGTQLLIAANVVMFTLEMANGEDGFFQNVYRLGALYPPAVRGGEWWRLIASLFLHINMVHLIMNMLGLAFLGPFIEYAFGFIRFLALYLLAGIASMAVVMFLGSGPAEQQLSLGASGSIMALVGAMLALMVRGWLRLNASRAKSKLLVLCMVIAIQSIFDLIVPQVSMTAHLSGVLIGFVIAILMPDRLTSSISKTTIAKV